MTILLFCLALVAPIFSRAETEADLVAKARTEKVLYVAGNQMITNREVVGAFKRKYPFLDLRIIDFDAVNARFRFFHLFESTSPGERGDVVLRALDKDIDEWIEHGWLARLDDLPDWKERAIQDVPSPYYAPYVGMAHGLAYNPDLIAEKDLPQSYDELLLPKWRGKVLIRSPLKGISVATFASYVRETRGIEWFRRLGANRPFVVQDYVDQHRLVNVGRYPIALSRDLEVASYAHQLLYDMHKKSKVKFALLREEVPYQYMIAGVNSGAFHPAAARLFVNFLISHQTEALLEKAGYSAGARRRSDLAHTKAWQWNMSGVKSMFEYSSYVARALREMRDGGAKIEPVIHFGRTSIE